MGKQEVDEIDSENPARKKLYDKFCELEESALKYAFANIFTSDRRSEHAFSRTASLNHVQEMKMSPVFRSKVKRTLSFMRQVWSYYI